MDLHSTAAVLCTLLLWQMTCASPTATTGETSFKDQGQSVGRNHNDVNVQEQGNIQQKCKRSLQKRSGDNYDTWLTGYEPPGIDQVPTGPPCQIFPITVEPPSVATTMPTTTTQPTTPRRATALVPSGNGPQNPYSGYVFFSHYPGAAGPVLYWYDATNGLVPVKGPVPGNGFNPTFGRVLLFPGNTQFPTNPFLPSSTVFPSNPLIPLHPAVVAKPQPPARRPCPTHKVTHKHHHSSHAKAPAVPVYPTNQLGPINRLALGTRLLSNGVGRKVGAVRNLVRILNSASSEEDKRRKREAGPVESSDVIPDADSAPLPRFIRRLVSRKQRKN